MFLFFLPLSQGETEKGLEMKKLVLSGFLASEEIYINQLDALLLVCIGANLLLRRTSYFANTGFLKKNNFNHVHLTVRVHTCLGVCVCVGVQCQG